MTTLRASRSIDSISATCTFAGAKIRRTGLSMLLGPIRPVIISPTKPWKVWKLSRLTTVTSSSPRATDRAERARQRDRDVAAAEHENVRGH